MLGITDLSCAALENAEDHSLGLTYWFDAEPTGEPYPVTVYLRGRLKGDTTGAPGRTTFETISTVDRVVPGSGRIAVTTRVPHVARGSWEVTATPVKPDLDRSRAPLVEATDARLGRGYAVGRTGFAPFIASLAPGVRLGAWPALVGTGFLLALAAQALIASRLVVPVLGTLLLTIVASALGLLSAKVYYLLSHPRERRNFLTAGMSVQGFVITTVGVLVIGSEMLGLPLGGVLDVTAPGLLFGMAVGRLGCLLGGCCVGRPTASRWGIWSSDRRIGVRRVPVQLLESSMAALLGVLALLAVVLLPTSGSGLVLVATVAAYVVGRQLLFPLRSIPRATAYGRPVSLIVGVLVLATALAILLLR